MGHQISIQHNHGGEHHFDINSTNLKALGFIDDGIIPSTSTNVNTNKKRKRSMSRIFDKLKSRDHHQYEEFFIDFCKRNHSLHLNKIINKKKKKSKTTKTTTMIADNDEHIKPTLSSLPTNGSNLNIPDISLLDPRRVVFVSLLGLYRTYMDTPTFILYSCLIILPLKRSWLYETEADLNSTSENNREGPKDSQNAANLLDKSHPATQQYLRFLKFKDSQDLIFWADDNHSSDSNDNNETSERVAGFYRYLSQRLSNMYCPIKQRYYAPLKTTIDCDQNKYESHFGVSKEDLLKELYFLTLKFKPMMEIIHQSNSESLNPMISYSPQNINTKYTQPKINKELQLEGFWISPDYDPYDIDEIPPEIDNL